MNNINSNKKARLPARQELSPEQGDSEFAVAGMEKGLNKQFDKFVVFIIKEGGENK